MKTRRPPVNAGRESTVTRTGANAKTRTNTYLIIVEEDVAAFIDQQGIRDINAYIAQLLERELQHQKASGQYKPKQIRQATRR